MTDSGLKARDIEALVYTQSPPPRRSGSVRRSRQTRAVPATVLGTTAIMLVAAALAWVLLRP
jgi:hypothetical protein